MNTPDLSTTDPLLQNTQQPLAKAGGPILLFFLALTIGRFLFQLQLYSQGFVSLSADEFARGLRSLAWSKSLHVNLLTDLLSPWPPFEMYLNGLAIRLLPDPFLAPRVTVFIASILLLLSLFFLVYHLLENWLIAGLAVLFCAAQPWFIWLSATPMLEIYFLGCFFGGLYFLLSWLRTKRGWGWLYAGFLFVLASGLHVQSWAQINLVNLLTLTFFVVWIKQRQFTLVGRLLLFWLLGNGFILFWGVAEYVTTGQFFAILNSHAEYSRWFYGGYNVDISEKLLYFPGIVGRVTPLWAWLAAGLGVVFLMMQQRLRPLLLLALGLMTLALASIFNLASGPPSAAPDRYALFYLLLLSPYVAYGFHQVAAYGRQWAAHRRSRLLANAWPVIIGLLLLGFLGQSMVAAQEFPNGMPGDTVETGRYLRQTLAEPALSSPPLQPQEKIMLEARYWDFLALELMIEQDARLLYDREHDYLHRENPSRLLESEQAVKRWLVSEQVGLLALRDPLLKERAATLPFLVPQKNVDNWSIFRLTPEP